MAATSTIISISVLTISFVLGAVFYFVVSTNTVSEKKSRLEAVISFVVNYILLIWVGKVVINWSIFIDDPLAVLAYPSNSEAFYFAYFVSVILLLFKVKKKGAYINSFLYTLLSVFLFASFTYEFIELVWFDNTYTWRYLTILFILLIIYLLLMKHLKPSLINAIIITLWGSGQLYLVLTLPFTTVFGYIISPWFLGLIIVLGFIKLIYETRKLV